MQRAVCMGALMALLSLVKTGILPEVRGQGSKLSGRAFNTYDNKALGDVAVYGLVQGNSRLLAKSNEQGMFEMSIPVENTAIRVVKSGFREMVVPLNHPSDRSGRFYFPLPLIPLDSQVSDSPYQQTEQKEYVMDASLSGGNSSGVKRRFLLKNAIGGKDVSDATICMVSTKSGKKDCFDVTPGELSPVKFFPETDIVAIHVEARGYQLYKGNLILDEIDGSTKDYEIRLMPELTVFTVTVTPATANYRYELLSEKGGTTRLAFSAPNHYYALVAPGGYELRATREQGSWPVERIVLRNGLTYKPIAVRIPPAALDAAAVPAVQDAADPGLPADLTVYFGQGAHELLPETIAKLDQLSSWLKVHPASALRLKGHTDNVGSIPVNITLSEYRCRRVLQYLVKKGINEKRIKWVGQGGASPARPNDSEDNKKWNRRVEIELIQ